MQHPFLRLVFIFILGLSTWCDAQNKKRNGFKKRVIPEQIPYYDGNTPAYKQARSSYPYITGYTFRSLGDFILDCAHTTFDPNKVEAGDVIFVSRDFIETFFTQYYSIIRCPFILLTHHYEGDCDPSVPGPYAHYLDHEKLVAWFMLNADIVHPKVKPLPLGIPNSFYDIGDTRVYDFHIKKFRHAPKTKLLCSNFSPNTQERLYMYNYFKDKSFCTTCPKLPQADYLAEMAQHKFVLSPRGGGIDCYRTWEALLLGCIPVVKSSAIDAVFKDLPVVIIHDWSEVTEEMLEQTYEKFQEQMSGYKFEKLYMPYWINEIFKYKYAAKLFF